MTLSAQDVDHLKEMPCIPSQSVSNEALLGLLLVVQ